jgi:hypothetical protein
MKLSVESIEFSEMVRKAILDRCTEVSEVYISESGRDWWRHSVDPETIFIDNNEVHFSIVEYWKSGAREITRVNFPLIYLIEDNWKDHYKRFLQFERLTKERTFDKKRIREKKVEKIWKKKK